MPTSCCVPLCHNKSGRDVVKFHRFPVDHEWRQKWIKALNLNFIPTHHRVCSNHFSPNSLCISGRLKPNSVPIKPKVPKTKVKNMSIPKDHNYCNAELLSPEATERDNSSIEPPRNNLRAELFDMTNSNQLQSLDGTHIQCIEIDEMQNENSNCWMKMRKKIKHAVVGTQIILKY